MNDIQDDIRQTLVVTKFEFTKHIKSNRFQGSLVLIPLITFLLYAVAFRGEPAPVNFAENYLEAIPHTVIILSIFFGADAISTEFEEKTGYVTLTNPIGRGWFLTGKLIAAFVIVAILTVILFLTGTIYMLLVYGETTSAFLISFLYSLALAGGALGVSIFLSSSLPGKITPWVTSYFLMIFVMPPLELYLRMYAHVEPWFLLTFAGRILPASVMEPSRTAIGEGGELIYNYPEFSVAVVVMLGYLLICFGLSILVFKRRELN